MYRETKKLKDRDSAVFVSPKKSFNTPNTATDLDDFCRDNTFSAGKEFISRFSFFSTPRALNRSDFNYNKDIFD
jgi:hypothetical protein